MAETLLLFLDVETTGLCRSLPDIDPRQPHMVEVAASLVDGRDQTHSEMSRIVRPCGWIIPPETTAIHGISTGEALAKGQRVELVLQELLELARRADLLVAHNVVFDHHVVRIALARFLPAELPWWNLRPRFCTMEAARRACGLGKLAPAYEALCGRRHETQHQALGDCDAARGIYFALLHRQQAAVGIR